MEKVVQASRKTGNTKATASPIARWFRDLMLPVFLKRFANPKALAWLYSYRVAWDARVGEAVGRESGRARVDATVTQSE